jgi:hypothetical protein
VVATLVFLALVVPGFHGNFVRILGILIGVFFFAGAAAAYFGRNRR